MKAAGPVLLQHVAERILSRWLQRQGKVEVHCTGGLHSFGGRSVDIVHAWQGAQWRIKVKPDPYFGTDPRRIADRALTFYRAATDAYAFEAVANAATREPGWMIESSADDLYYYRIVISQPEDEVAALFEEPDEVFFSELAVDADQLVVLPMRATAEWFERNFERYAPRPVVIEGPPAWFRLVPRSDIDAAVSGIKHVGPVMSTLSR